MLIFNKKKAMYDFYNKHRAFLYWYLKKHANLSEKLYYLLMQYIVECLIDDVGKLVRLDEQEQRRWIMNQVNDFTTKE